MEEDFISRTPNGLFAEATVREVSYIFHIEGKGDSSDITKLPDYIYYNAIISEFFGGTYEIKVEGGKNNLRSMIDSLSTAMDDDTSHVIFMDRDHDEFISNGLISNSFVFYTLGYSFENDLWTSSILRKILSSFCATESVINGFVKNWKELEKKISFIHKFNLLSRVNGKQIFTFKGLCGLTFNYSGGLFSIDQNCIMRFAALWNGFNIRSTRKTKDTNLLLKNNFYAHPGYLIQGHAYESYMLEAIHQFYGECQLFEQKTKSFPMYKHMAFTHFCGSPRSYLSDSTINHYESIFERISQV
jgi:hypothetical protein